MDPHTQANMFEPFFTTKERGKGTGLGLATVYGIVRQSGGHILVSSEVGFGTTVKAYLPRVSQGLEAAEPVPPADRPVDGSETVLLVEDEDSIRTLLGRKLRDRGYQVLEAREGQAAVDLCRRHQGPIHLLLTDVVMPRVGGRELAERLAPMRPDMRVLYICPATPTTRSSVTAFWSRTRPLFKSRSRRASSCARCATCWMSIGSAVAFRRSPPASAGRARLDLGPVFG
jgi:CheY-like chemotaxis protein